MSGKANVVIEPRASPLRQNARLSGSLKLSVAAAISRSFATAAAAGVSELTSNQTLDIESLSQLHRSVRLFKKEVIPRVAA
jgi:hypothetical protein